MAPPDEKRDKFSKSFRSAEHQNISFGIRSQQFSPKNKKLKAENEKYNQKKKEAYKFRFGNYHQYYGYRNQGQTDPRITCMKQEWFSGKDVLDIGCNAGHLTLALAKCFSPKCIIGIDIDEELIKMAKKNVRHYVAPENINDEDFPISFPLTYGPVAQSMDTKGRYSESNFPFNVQFIKANFILSSDEFVNSQMPYFDTILCLSVTKWVHLNWGDIGIRRLFRRTYKLLRPGGNFILEAQLFQSYARKKKIAEELYQNYNCIELFPEMFNEFLLKEVGFETCQLIDTPAHSSLGFSRPIYLFTKAARTEKQPKHVIYNFSSDSACEDSDVEQVSD
ncbi:7SK snRNA methylphosphate capping enzyme [Trichonephila clavata]|uniref:RNA methyltransferase n=1 Tax=Trichonephila clavata TaxID=2740835 RepID=A0A8X6GWL5_TRICU|nr:7SK snRNA methylphosphate capping enzyme [Trichonephila clavata]